jgi:hypothetical protein
MFFALQFADIYTTYKGLQYSCVTELNPIIGKNPSVSDMFLTKTVILTPAIMIDLKNEVMDRVTMTNVNTLMTVVILNNYDVYRYAKDNCRKT